MSQIAPDEPEAYQIGWIPFLGLKIYLDSRPLIPRPETEWWTEEFAIKRMRGAEKESRTWPSGPERSLFRLPEEASEFRFLDLCAGSGAIGCAVLKACPNAKVFFGEIEPAHEATIRKNIRENGLDETRAHVRIGDLFEPFARQSDFTLASPIVHNKVKSKKEMFDFIASNPPYVPEARVLPPNVTDYEPALALRAGSDGLTVIRRIAKDLPKYLKPEGQAWIECDSEHAAAAAACFETEGFKVEIRPDQYDRPRLLVISFDHGRPTA